MTPIKYGFVDFKKCNLLDNRLLLGIDCGTTLIKVIFLHKGNETQFFDDKKDFITLKHGLFKNENFEEAIKFIRDEAYFPPNKQYKVHLTGNGSAYKIELVESILGRQVEYIEENLSTIAGHRIALERIGLEKLIAAPVEVRNLGKIKSEFLENVVKARNSKLVKANVKEDDESKIFPCLIYIFGSESKIYYFNGQGEGELVGYPMTGGKSFLGLAKCLLNTNDYSEIIQLASSGNRANVDSQVKDLLADDINSPYGKLPPELPIFAFGKGMDFNMGLEEFTKEDLAMSLVGYFGRFMMTYSMQLCQMKGTKRIFLTGNIFQSNLFQKEIKQSLMIFPYQIQLEILDQGYFKALGAMVLDLHHD